MKTYHARGWSYGATHIEAETPQEAIRLYKERSGLAQEQGHWAIEIRNIDNVLGDPLYVEPGKDQP